MSAGEKWTVCRLCGEPLVEFFSLGELYVSDFIPLESGPRLPKIPLTLCLAPSSGLIQLTHSTPPDDMYREYWYRSGTNASMTAELKDIAETAARLIKLEKGDVFVDIGCNDGTLFKFVPKDIHRIGFEPAKNGFVEQAAEHASHVVNNYFSAEAFNKSHFVNTKAKVVTSIAMFYDLDNPKAFIDDIKEILDDDGLWIVQMSYLPLMIKQLAFDNICHEHVAYYSLEAFKDLVEERGFSVVDCELNDVNGGSFRAYMRKKEADPTKFATSPYRDVAAYRVASILSHEKSLSLKDPKTYQGFFDKINSLKRDVVDFIKSEKAQGKKIWGYGASTKGNTLLQWFGLDDSLIDGIAERSPAKFGLKTAGTNISITDEETMRKAKPDYLLILPWHFINEFKSREQGFLRSGGKFIVPCPKFEVIEY